MASRITELDPLDSELEFDEDEEGYQVENWDDWNSDEDDSTGASAAAYLCLFCDSRFDSTDALFGHCSSTHCFNFRGIVSDAGLDFYGSFKLINYVRSQVAENNCWCCGANFQCNEDLQSHLHAAVSYENDGKFLWENDSYLRPFMQDDELLHCFVSDEDEEDDTAAIDKMELMRDLMDSGELDLAEICIDSQNFIDISSSDHDVLNEIRKGDPCGENMTGHSVKTMSNGTVVDNMDGDEALFQKQKHKQPRVPFVNVLATKIKNVNDNYFGAYGSFGIHREMISDSVRMDAYRGALLNNPSLMNQATVMDVGCGTGILSLFAAQAGASRVIAVEASVKMASVATQIVKDNGALSENQKGDERQNTGVITVVQGMVEELDKVMQISPQSVDVLVSEWMGYCLLYESMLTSVLYARDHWLKPGGAILPDTATIFAAGFGKGGTSLPFWENVYGFNMSCIGKEVVEDATRLPIVDVVDSRDIVTESVILQAFDLATMKPEEMDFTSVCELKLNSDHPKVEAKPRVSWCHGVVLWFDTAFTSRFCKETPTVLSTSPYSKSTHWSQSIFTFQEPVAMTSGESIPDSAATVGTDRSPVSKIPDSAATVGTDRSPVSKIKCRISIARSFTHRSIDISMETTGIGPDGRSRSWPAQIFNL